MKPLMNNRRVARRAVDDIISDIMDRRGLGDALGETDVEVLDEIQQRWQQLIIYRLEEAQEGG